MMEMFMLSQHEELQYLNLINEIINNGTFEEGRNGKTKMIFGASMKFDLTDKKVPVLTTKKVAWKTCLRELLWFVKGDTDNKHLKEQGVKIWNENASREFLDSRGLTDLREDDLGPVYGHQWRFFNAPYTSCDEDYKGKGVDQLQYIIDCLKDPKQRTSRRLVMSAWNPNQLDEMALPPCHVLCQFNVREGKYLSCALYQRSGDVGLGVPFNIASYSFLTHILAKHCDLEADKFVYFLGNAHIYDNHIEMLQEQVKRSPSYFPTFEVKNKYENIDDYKIEDFELVNYNPQESIKMEMRK